MYDINLIRDNVVPDQHKNIMFSVISVSALIYVLTILAVVFFSAANFRMIDVYASEISKLEDDVTALYPTTPSQRDLKEILERIEPDLKEISALIDHRTEVTYLWESVARAVPEGVWLTRVDLKLPAEQGRKGSSGLFIEGMALASGDTGGDEAIRAFAQSLEEIAEFQGLIEEAKFAETGKSRIGGENVIGFEITCPFK